MNAEVHVAILGGSGYGAGELLRLLTQHPAVRVVSVTSSSQVGEPIDVVHPHLRGFYDLRLVESVDAATLFAAPHAVVFSAMPHGASGVAIARLIEQWGPDRAEGVRFIDLSGDLRLADADLHQRYYPHTPLLAEWRRQAVYGLPELSRDRIRSARLVANPGCLASAAILAAAPLMDADFAGPVAIDVKTASSGSGRALKDTTHHPTRHADFRAYQPLAHPHEPEIRQAWGDPLGRRIETTFVPHSMDAARGIFATVHLTLAGAPDTESLRRRYQDYYASSPFVRIVDQSPSLQNVVGSNFCDLAVAGRGRQVIALAAIDNLVKGMAGTAIQNLNLMCGLPETTGLWAPSFRPV